MTTSTDSPGAWLPLPVGLAPGFMVGPWRIEHELGAGGMGVVYAAVHELIGKRVAIKILQKRASSPGGERFLTEARAVNQIGHPNIVDIFETGTLDDGRPYFVMERLNGQTLGDRAAAGQLSPVEAIDYLLPLCDALAAAHAAGIVHRDIKLDNVFLVETTHGPFVKLLDWGIASVANADGTHDRSELVGTPRYLSPEQACGEPATRAGDVYSLGVLAYELFLEQPPFSAITPIALLLKHVNEVPPRPRTRWAEIPQALEDLLLDMLEKSPSLRPNVTEVAAQLRQIRTDLATLPLRVTTSPSMQRVAPRTIGHSATLLAPSTTSVARPTRRAWVGAVALVAAMVGARFFIDDRTAQALSAPVPSAQAAAATVSGAPAPDRDPDALALSDVHDAEIELDDVERPAAASRDVAPRSRAQGARPAAAVRTAAGHDVAPRTTAARGRTPATRRLHRDAVIDTY